MIKKQRKPLILMGALLLTAPLLFPLPEFYDGVFLFLGLLFIGYCLTSLLQDAVLRFLFKRKDAQTTLPPPLDKRNTTIDRRH